MGCEWSRAEARERSNVDGALFGCCPHLGHGWGGGPILKTQKKLIICLCHSVLLCLGQKKASLRARMCVELFLRRKSSDRGFSEGLLLTG